MLEGVLKEPGKKKPTPIYVRFNPWYVGGGVKSVVGEWKSREMKGFNPWYVGGGVKSWSHMVTSFR